MKEGSAPGADGLPVEVYKTLQEECVRPMLWAIQECLRVGECPPGWVIPLQRNIPKTPTADMLADMRPIALQNVVFKWLATVVLIQLQDALQIIIPGSQKGFMKGRRMLDHIEKARLMWESSEHINMLLVDFSKAYDTVQHAFFAAALRFFTVPEPYVRLLVSALKGAVLFCVDSGYVREVCMVPGSGIRQGDPLSPAIFALLTVFLIFLVERDCPEAELLLYADDLLISFVGRRRKRDAVARKVLAALAQFGLYSGLHINYKKTYVLVKSPGEAVPQQVAGVQVVPRQRYLGIQLGHVTSAQAFAPALAKMKSRAAFLKSLPLDQMERAELYKVWIQPLVNLTARVYEPDASVISTMNMVFTMALGVTSWGLAPSMVAADSREGGLKTQPLRVYALFLFSQLWISFIQHRRRYAGPWADVCAAWAREIGLCLSPGFLPYCQLAVVRGVRSLLQRSCKCFSQLRRNAPHPAVVGKASGMPIWHNVLFRNDALRTYFAPAMVRKGVITLGDALSCEAFVVAPTWVGIYEQQMQWLRQQRVQELAPVWGSMGSGRFLQFMQPLGAPPERQTADVWGVFEAVKLPGRAKDYIRHALWAKLSVGARTQHVYHRPKCVLCDVLETTRHAVAFCKFMGFASDVVVKSFGPLWSNTGQQLSLQDSLLTHPLKALQSTQGLSLWAASFVSWRLRCDAVFRDKSPTVQDFAGRWAATMLWWATADETSLYRQESMHIYRELQLFISGAPMFQGGVRAPTGAILPQRQRHLPKWIRWASLLPEKQREIDQKLKDGWEVCYTDGSRTETAGVSHAGYGVWYSTGNPRNVRAAVPAHEKQTIGRAELRGVLAAVQGKTPGIKLHIVTDSEIVWAGLQGKCAKWERHAWVGSRGALAHRDLWMQLWQSWQLLGDSVSIQWVPSHAGVEGNEQADKCAVRGAELSLPGVVREKEASEVWRELGLEEMPEQDEEPEENWDTVDSETDSTDAGSTADSTDAEMMSESEEGGSSECELVCRPQKSGRVR